MHAVAACCVHVPERVDLESVGDACVDVRERSAVQQRIGAQVDVELVAIRTLAHQSQRGEEGDAHRRRASGVLA